MSETSRDRSHSCSDFEHSSAELGQVGPKEVKSNVDFAQIRAQELLQVVSLRRNPSEGKWRVALQMLKQVLSAVPQFVHPKLRFKLVTASSKSRA
jgi:hypothetical protein